MEQASVSVFPESLRDDATPCGDHSVGTSRVMAQPPGGSGSPNAS